MKNYVSLSTLRSYPYRLNLKPGTYHWTRGRRLYRGISLYMTWICLNLGFSANQITVGQLIAGIVGAAAVACPHLWIGLLGLFLFQLGYLLDNIDGEIARYRRQVSLTGKYLDEVGHVTVVPLMYIGFAVGEFMRHGRWEILLFAMLAGLFSLRLDLFAKSEVILDFARSGSNLKADFYKEVRKPAMNTDVKKPRFVQVLFSIFAYPSNMNILSIAWLLDHFTGMGMIVYGPAGLVYILIVANGVLIPLRRGITIRSVVSSSQVETDFLELEEKISTSINSRRSNSTNS